MCKLEKSSKLTWIFSVSLKGAYPELVVVSNCICRPVNKSYLLYLPKLAGAEDWMRKLEPEIFKDKGRDHNMEKAIDLNLSRVTEQVLL